jgi:phage shock protein PspC (stress-responsive transcriptional regulator)
MSQTQGPPPADQQHSTGNDVPPRGAPGVDRAHLRSFEQLRRSVSDRKIAGVAGGLGRHLNVDPTVLRVLLVVLCLFGAAGFVLYGVAWLVVPEDGEEEGRISMRPGTRNAVLIVTGVVAALLVVGHTWNGLGVPWPLVLIGVAVLVYLAFRDRDRHPPQVQGPATYPPGYPPTYSTATGPDAAPVPETTGYQPPPPWTPAPGPTPIPPRSRKRGPLLFGFTVALIALALGSLGLYDASGGDVVDSAYPALALAVVGVMLVVGAFVGRAGGLIFLGIVSALALAVTAVLGSVGDLGRRDAERLNATPASATAVQARYFVPHGRVFVDLSEVSDPQSLDGRTIDVSTRVGEVVVVLPRGIVSHVDADVSGPGQIDLPEHSSGGIDNSISETVGSGPGTLSITSHVVAGHIEVRNP